MNWFQTSIFWGEAAGWEKRWEKKSEESSSDGEVRPAGNEESVLGAQSTRTLVPWNLAWYQATLIREVTRARPCILIHMGEIVY